MTSQDTIRLESKIDEILKTLNGNGTPGIKTRIATTEQAVETIRSDVDELKRDQKERDKEKRAFWTSITLLALGNIGSVVLAIFK